MNENRFDAFCRKGRIRLICGRGEVINDKTRQSNHQGNTTEVTCERADGGAEREESGERSVREESGEGSAVENEGMRAWESTGGGAKVRNRLFLGPPFQP